ncbi:EmrB/QacA subfamily drug resistance transporter [Chryseobacterium sp. 52]|uniref:MFS transporter n=1 Tax=Chryseobacterium sp. 52 TaxID=2035213 RepID=UPI000C18CF0D|nr:MFS transporter [Chryseobacterium sp. 52]PIF47180.1 EmrB/QacA subfamily drug resistance transporter [Chryseobacterium sp. 52]
MNTKYLKLIVILSGQLLTIMDIFIINVSIPSIQRDLHASNGEMQLMIASYLIGFASFLITGGRLGDMYGRKKIFITGLVFFMLSSVACGVSSGATLLVVARFIQGVSAALMSPQVLSMIQILFTGHEERTKAMGWYGITIGTGTILGQFLGGYFSSMTIMEESWRLIFLINIPIGLLAIFFSRKILGESTISTRKNTFDFFGVIVLGTGLFCFTYALTRSEHQGIQLESISLILISVLIFMYFVKNQKMRLKTGKPYLMDFTLFSYTNFNLGILAVSFFFIMLDSYFYILSLFFQDGLQIGALDAGEIIVFQGLGFILASLFSARFILRYGKKFLMVGLALIMMVLILQILLFDREAPFSVLYLLLFFHGIGVGSIIPALASIALSGLPEKLAGNASGVYNTFQQAAAIVGIIVIGSVFYDVLGTKPSPQDYHHAFSVALIVNMVCVVIVLFSIIKVSDDVFPKRKG